MPPPKPARALLAIALVALMRATAAHDRYEKLLDLARASGADAPTLVYAIETLRRRERQLDADARRYGAEAHNDDDRVQEDSFASYVAASATSSRGARVGARRRDPHAREGATEGAPEGATEGAPDAARHARRTERRAIAEAYQQLAGEVREAAAASRPLR